MRATIQLWHPTDGQPLVELPAVDTLVALACAVMDGTPIALSGGQSGIVHIWDLAAHQLMGSPLIVHSGPVRSIECAVLDGKSVAITTSGDQTVHLWDLHERATITTFPVHAPHAATITDTGELIIGFHNDIALLRRLPHDRTTPL
jgi:WD40 repeat protein